MAVSSQIEDAVRNHQSRGPTGKVMVEGPCGHLCPDPACAIELSEELLGFGVDGKHRIPRVKVLTLKIGDLLELCVAER